MFISWAVTSYQSNGAKCDFSQGISVCLIEIPYPICPACRLFAFAARLSAQFSRYSLFPLTVLSLFRFAFSLSPFFYLLLSLHFVVTSLVPLRAALFRLICLRPSHYSLSFSSSSPQTLLFFPVDVSQVARLSFGFTGFNANRYYILSIMLFIARYLSASSTNQP